MNVPEKIKNKSLYRKVKEEILNKYPKHSAYRSMLIIKEYKKRGGEIDEKKEKKSGLNRWLKEEWVNVYAYLKENKKISCGKNEYIKKSACRPLTKISQKTPITINELLKLHSKESILKAIEKKNKDPQNTIMNWKTLTVKKKN